MRSSEKYIRTSISSGYSWNSSINNRSESLEHLRTENNLKKKSADKLAQRIIRQDEELQDLKNQLASLQFQIKSVTVEKNKFRTALEKIAYNIDHPSGLSEIEAEKMRSVAKDVLLPHYYHYYAAWTSTTPLVKDKQVFVTTKTVQIETSHVKSGELSALSQKAPL